MIVIEPTPEAQNQMELDEFTLARLGRLAKPSRTDLLAQVVESVKKRHLERVKETLSKCDDITFLALLQPRIVITYDVDSGEIDIKVKREIKVAKS
jgi:hypothetical protein